MNEFEFSVAKSEDLPELIALYESLKGTPGCTWHAEYPTWEIIKSDIDRGSLYLLRDKGIIVAGAAAGDDEESLAEFGWEYANYCVLARVGVAKDYQGKGTGSYLVKKVTEEVKKRGFDGIVLLVNKYYPSGIALYERNGFTRIGEAAIEQYGLNFYKYELKF